MAIGLLPFCLSAPAIPFSLKEKMGLFKKKKKEEAVKHTDFSKYKIKINGKTMCAYESLTGKPFLKIETEDEIKHLFYCSLVINNEEFSTMEYGVFEYLLLDQEVVSWMSDEYVKIGKYLAQFKAGIGDFDEGGNIQGEEEENKAFYMLEAVTGLIVKMGRDPHYVYYEMEEWEISYYYRMMQELERSRLAEERLWTYLQVLPHVGKKLGGPEKLLPFPWENSKKKLEDKMNKDTAAAVAFLGGKRNGTKQPDNNT